MAKFKVKVEETLVGYYIVEAETADEAEEKVYEEYNNGSIYLDSDNFLDVEVNSVGEPKENDSIYYKEL